MKTHVYQEIAGLLGAIAACRKSGNAEWLAKHQERLAAIVREYMPSGAGWDNGTSLDENKSTSEKLVFLGGFHHMDEHGGYDGWTQHEIIVRPSLQFGITVRVTGRDRNDIKNYLGDIFHEALIAEYDRAKVDELMAR
jgi:hypothetical protein